MGIRRQCECSGTAFTDIFGPLSANICPSCFIEGSTVTYENTSIGFSFSSNNVNPPECFSINGQTILNTSGTGTITTGTETFTGTFTITLVDGPGEFDDSIIFTLVGIDTEGFPFAHTSVITGLSEESVIITGCNLTITDKGIDSSAANSVHTEKFSEIKTLSKGKWYEYTS
ncbi:hypothetical protein [Neobacillus kokaensis]|uniref:Uncharacterized protein n=1 Tax=Neobacillus kokaensis TaxID=2759023 RepID=A0ABQ3N5P9_9BACI|nr:hypothetical protein [Neobacillus kokaensis]GHH98823.1 hypothetical protein AM1BK_23660 [Neobacillus kokaensis]